MFQLYLVLQCKKNALSWLSDAVGAGGFSLSSQMTAGIVCPPGWVRRLL